MKTCQFQTITRKLAFETIEALTIIGQRLGSNIPVVPSACSAAHLELWSTRFLAVRGLLFSPSYKNKQATSKYTSFFNMMQHSNLYELTEN